MFYALFFIVPFVCAMLMIFMPASIKNIDKLPVWFSVDIGRLHAEDIRGFNDSQRRYLRRQVFVHLAIAAAVTALIGVVFVINGYGVIAAILPCLAIQVLAGTLWLWRLLQKAGAMRP